MTDHPTAGAAAGAVPEGSAMSRRFLALLGISALLGVVIALVFAGFEEAMGHGRELLWGDTLADGPDAPVVIGLCVAGALLVALGVRVLPGHGGAHPADAHGVESALDPSLSRIPVLLGALVVGLVGLSFGAPLGPEGALLPVIGGLTILAARLGRTDDRERNLVLGAGVGALVAVMFGSPLAGVVGLMEMVPTAPGATTALLALPAFTASATAVLTLQVIHFHSPGSLPFTYAEFRPVHLLWAVLIGVVAGAAGLLLDPAVQRLRRLTRRTDAINPFLTAAAGGLVIGLLYLAAGPSVRFSGVPEILYAVVHTESGWKSLALVAAKVAVTGLAVAIGIRGGRIFPSAFIGGAVGLALHLFVSAIPLEIAVGVGLVASMATAMGTPVMAGLIAASLMSPAMLPLGIVGVVAAHTVHLLEGQVAAMAAAGPGQGAAAGGAGHGT